MKTYAYVISRDEVYTVLELLGMDNAAEHLTQIEESEGASGPPNRFFIGMEVLATGHVQPLGEPIN